MFSTVLHWVLIIAVVGNVLIWGSMGIVFIYTTIKNRFLCGKTGKAPDTGDAEASDKSQKPLGLQ